ncbi:ParM/StbA family protein [Anaerostipes caccae]|uniref:ParM/StbA family protein n=1 Tax=Anaerostipes caccae TaxID=105841 RepID=UPI002673F9C3|nr:ParM/StbA family protein [Anaerostipes caccae]
MIKKLRVPVDHGNRNTKTANFIFTTGLNMLDKKPARGERYLQYEGKYYTLSEKRIPYQRDKTQDSRFYVLTLFAIAMELETKSQILPGDIVQISLPIGLPPKHFAELCDKYETFFRGDGKVKDFNYNGKDYHICISKAVAFPQDYAAMMTMAAEVSKIPKAVGIDIGGFTTDYLLMRHGELDMDYCDSMEKGVITMYNQIISNINSEYDMLLEESDIDSILKGQTQYYDTNVVRMVENSVQDFVTDLLNSIRERGIDTKSTYAIFIGGGAVLLKKFIEKADRLGKYMFIEDLRANAKGYEILYQMYENGK